MPSRVLMLCQWDTLDSQYEWIQRIPKVSNGTSAPSACAIGDLFIDTDAAAGQRLLVCEATNTWRPQGTGGGTATDLDCEDCVELATETTGTYVSGPAVDQGLVLSGSGDARNIGLIACTPSASQALVYQTSTWACQAVGSGDVTGVGDCTGGDCFAAATGGAQNQWLCFSDDAADNTSCLTTEGSTWLADYEIDIPTGNGTMCVGGSACGAWATGLDDNADGTNAYFTFDAGADDADLNLNQTGVAEFAWHMTGTDSYFRWATGDCTGTCASYGANWLCYDGEGVISYCEPIGELWEPLIMTGTATNLACSDCVELGSETTGNYLSGVEPGLGLQTVGAGEAKTVRLQACSEGQYLAYTLTPEAAWECDAGPAWGKGVDYDQNGTNPQISIDTGAADIKFDGNADGSPDWVFNYEGGKEYFYWGGTAGDCDGGGTCPATNTWCNNGGTLCWCDDDGPPYHWICGASKAFSDDPDDCGANQFANAINASGDLTCAAIADADVPDGITASNYLPLAGGTLTGDLVLSADAGEGLSGGGLSADCDNPTTSKLLWDSSTKKFSCGTDQTGGGGAVLATAWSMLNATASGEPMIPTEGVNNALTFPVAVTLSSLACQGNAQLSSGTITLTVSKNGSASDLVVTLTSSEGAYTGTQDTTCTSNCSLAAGNYVTIDQTGSSPSPNNSIDVNCVLLVSID